MQNSAKRFVDYVSNSLVGNALRGIRTLAVRTERQHASALHIAHALQTHPKVAEVMHPFLESHPQHQLARSQMRMGGTLVSFEITGGTDACRSFMKSLRLVRPATSFGGPETLVCHPATAIQVGVSGDELAATGVTDGLLRLSVGLENAEDLVSDVTAALEAARGIASSLGCAHGQWYDVEGTIMGDGRGWDTVCFDSFPDAESWRRWRDAVAEHPVASLLCDSSRVDGYCVAVEPQIDRITLR